MMRTIFLNFVSAPEHANVQVRRVYVSYDANALLATTIENMPSRKVIVL